MNSNSINKFEKYKRAIILLISMIAMVGLGGCEVVLGVMFISGTIISMLPVIFFGGFLMVITSSICKKLQITKENSVFLSILIGLIPIFIVLLNFKKYLALIGKFF